MESRCEWCQEESDTLTPVVNRDVMLPTERVFVCRACKEVEQFEHADELLWNVVDFASLNSGRLYEVAA
jgi:hypothetical protein